jgi:hypothetical protein
VRFHRPRTDAQPCADLVVRGAVDHAAQDVPFAVGQRDPIPGPHPEVEAARRRAPDGVEQLGGGCGLDHETGGAEAEGGIGVLGIVERGHHDDRRHVARVLVAEQVETRLLAESQVQQ